MTCLPHWPWPPTQQRRLCAAEPSQSTSPSSPSRLHCLHGDGALARLSCSPWQRCDLAWGDSRWEPQTHHREWRLEKVVGTAWRRWPKGGGWEAAAQGVRLRKRGSAEAAQFGRAGRRPGLGAYASLSVLPFFSLTFLSLLVEIHGKPQQRTIW